MKQTIRKAAGGAPANFVAFLQGGTTSRVTPKEFLPALAYLVSRFEGSELCDDCETLSNQVSDTVKSDIATWFVGMGLSKKGDIPDENLKKQACTITNMVHGKAFEILGTAMYHALYEFGDDLGIDSEKYEILLSDPRAGNQILQVGLMSKRSGNVVPYNKPYQRKPDLVLFGEGVDNRTWIEFKSWRYNPKYLKTGSDALNQSDFPLWKAKPGEKQDKYTTNAQKQHFLDYAATLDTVTNDYWDNQPFAEFKPTTHRAWIQIWEEGPRTWRALVKRNGKYELEKNTTTRNVATPWIRSTNLTSGVVATVPREFKALQRFLTDVSPDMNKTMFKTTVGYSLKEHKVMHQNAQISSSLQELMNSSVVPFNIATFLAIELGSSSGDQIANFKEQIRKAIGEGDFGELQAMLDKGDITEEQVEQLRELISDEIDEMLGPLQYLLFDIPLISDLEDALGDVALGEEFEAAREKAANYELDEDIFETLCEAP